MLRLVTESCTVRTLTVSSFSHLIQIYQHLVMLLSNDFTAAKKWGSTR